MFVEYGVHPFTRSIFGRGSGGCASLFSFTGFTVLRFYGTIIPGFPEQWECQITHTFQSPQRTITQKEVIIHFTSPVESSTVLTQEGIGYKQIPNPNNCNVVNHNHGSAFAHNHLLPMSCSRKYPLPRLREGVVDDAKMGRERMR